MLFIGNKTKNVIFVGKLVHAYAINSPIPATPTTQIGPITRQEPTQRALDNPGCFFDAKSLILPIMMD
jgi:hypothetical protein